MKNSNKTYEPDYIMWWEKEFLADMYVSRNMRPLDRLFYRALLIQSSFNSERPYLPNDDHQLWMLADAESLEQWMEHKAIVMKKFILTTDEQHWAHKRVMADWQLMLEKHNQRVRAGKNTRFAKQEQATAQHPPSDCPAPAERLTANQTEQNQPTNQPASPANGLAGKEGREFLQRAAAIGMGIPTQKELEQLIALVATEPQNGFEFLKHAVLTGFMNRPQTLEGLKNPWFTFLKESYIHFANAKQTLMASGDWRLQHVPGERELHDSNIARQTEQIVARRHQIVPQNEMSLEDFNN